MNVVIDNCAFTGPITGGISTVWYELITRLMRDGEFKLEFIDVYSRNNQHRKLLDFSDYYCYKDFLYPLSQYTPFYINKEVPFIFHSPYYRYCPSNNAVNITTVHDFTYEYFRKGLPKWIHQYHKYSSIRHSDYIVCISQNTKMDLLKFLPDIDEEKIHVIYNGVSEDYHVIDKESIGNTDLPFEQYSYLVFLGSRASYKNFDFVKENVYNTKYNLLIVGPSLTPEEEQSLQMYLPADRFKATGFLSNEKLNIVLNYALGLVYPSSYEGFGIPVIEAQRAGCPVIAYNASSIPEVIGESPLLMKELSRNEFLEKLDILSDDACRSKIIEDGIENSKRFSWEIMYQNYRKLYKEIIESK